MVGFNKGGRFFTFLGRSDQLLKIPWVVWQKKKKKLTMMTILKKKTTTTNQAESKRKNSNAHNPFRELAIDWLGRSEGRSVSFPPPAVCPPPLCAHTRLIAGRRDRKKKNFFFFSRRRSLLDLLGVLMDHPPPIDFDRSDRKGFSNCWEELNFVMKLITE